MQIYMRSLLVVLMLFLATEVYAVEQVQGNDTVNADETATEESTTTVTQETIDTPIEEQAEDSTMIEAFPEEDETEQKAMLSVLDSPHKYVSEYIEWLVTGVDKFFANEALYKYSTDSYVQLSGEALHEEMIAKTSYKARLRARVDLPRTKKKLKLLIDTDPTEKQDPISRSVDQTPTGTTQNSDVYASVQRERERKGWLIRPSVGVKLNLPLEPFAKLQFTNLYPYQYWQLRLNENLYWFDDTGFGSDSTFDFDLPVGDGNLFRATSFARWTEETNYFALSQTFAFYQTLSPTRKISYQIGAYGQTQPTWYMTQYLAVIRYRQNIHKDWLFFEIQPQVLYQKINDWNDEISLLLKLEMLFGKKYL
jgi:hypothetical protein